MKGMENKSTDTRRHPWNVSCPEAWAIVSQGHRVSLETAVRLTLQVADGFRIPRPTRDADHFASEIKRKLLGGELSEK
jgi:deoxyinosine 3'endonuclease (endonuclease V)